MFYGLQNLNHEFRCTYVQFIVIVPGVRSSLPGINISERTEHVIVKAVSSFLKVSPQHVVLNVLKLIVAKITFTWFGRWMTENGGMISIGYNNSTPGENNLTASLWVINSRTNCTRTEPGSSA